MTQPAFALEPEPQPKRVASTSIAAYREIAPSLPEREALVLAGMQGHAPMTAYELYRSMEADGLADDGLFDLNAVRPRLTALEARGLIAKGEKRQCRITGKTAYVWVVASGQAHPAVDPQGDSNTGTRPTREATSHV